MTGSLIGMVLATTLTFSWVTTIPNVGDIPFLTGTASWYDYTLTINWTKRRWSKDHDTCALRIYERYQTYKVCSKVTGKCIKCYHNDYGPARQDRVIDLSSHAFKELWVSLKRGLTEVEVFELPESERIKKKK